MSLIKEIRNEQQGVTIMSNSYRKDVGDDPTPRVSKKTAAAIFTALALGATALYYGTKDAPQEHAAAQPATTESQPTRTP